jgi:NAD(P)H-flavin reductase
MVSASTAPYAPRLHRVKHTTIERRDTCSITLDLPADIPFRPGQFNMLYAFGIGEVAISVSGAPTSCSELMHTIRSVGSISDALTKLRVGDTVGVRGPFGTAWPLERLRHRDLIFIAGGLGIAALRSAILFVLARRAEYGRLTVLYGARSPDRFVFRRDLDVWQTAPDVAVRLIVDSPDAGWTGSIGPITSLVDALEPGPNAAALVCGPDAMMQGSARALRNAGLSASSIWLSLERNMKCGIGLCGHCQLGTLLLCRDGPIERFDHLAPLLSVPEF